MTQRGAIDYFITIAEHISAVIHSNHYFPPLSTAPFSADVKLSFFEYVHSTLALAKFPLIFQPLTSP